MRSGIPGWIDVFSTSWGVGDLATFDPCPGWQRRAGDEVLRIPVGAAVGASDSAVSIELSARTSVVLCVGLYGKTVALQSLALSLCTRYPPTRVQLAVADYQNGIGRGGLPPHIAAHRAQHRPANPPGHWESWCAYLNTGLDRRAGQLGEYPELVVVIDALSELLGVSIRRWRP